MEITSQPPTPAPDPGADQQPHGSTTQLPSSNGNGRTSAKVRGGVLTRLGSRILSDRSLTKKASLNAAAAAAEQGASVVAGLLITPFLVTRLGDTIFGIWQVLQRLIGHASPASGRPGEALKWTVAHEKYSTDVDYKRRQVGNAVAVWAIFVPVLVLVGGVVAWYSPIWLGVSQAQYGLVRLAAAVLVLDAVIFALMYLPQSVLLGENLGYKRLGLSVLLIAVNKVFLAGAVLLGFGLTGLAVATAMGTVLTGVMYTYITRSQVSWFGIARPSLAEVRGFISLSWWFLVWNLVMQAMQASDMVVLGIVASPALVTTYVLTRYLPQAITLAAATLIFAVMPGLGGLIGAGDFKRAVRVRTEIMSMVWLMATIAGATVLLWERSFLGLWVGERYYPGEATILMIMLMVIQWAIVRVDSNIIDLTLKLRRKVLLGALSAAISVACAWFFLGPLHMGILGLALGFIVGRVVLSVSYPLMIGRMLQIPLHQQLTGLVRPSLVTAALFVGAALLAPSLHARSWFSLIAAGGVSTVMISIVALQAGLSRETRRLVWRRVRRVARLT